MELEHHIIKAIRQYPTLFKAENFEKSSVLVLDHLFLVIGNGFEWYDGYLTDDEKPYGKLKAKPLPNDFFSKIEYSYYRITKQLYEITIGENDLKLGHVPIKKGNNYYWQRKNHLYGYKYSPYSICKYSAFLTMPKTVKGDWYEGAVKIAQMALRFYKDPVSVKRDSYYPNKIRLGTVTRDFEKLTKESRFEKVAIKWWGAKPEEEKNPIKYIRRFWKNHRRKQIRYLEQFLFKPQPQVDLFKPLVRKQGNT